MVLAELGEKVLSKCITYAPVTSAENEKGVLVARSYLCISVLSGLVTKKLMSFPEPPEALTVP